MSRPLSIALIIDSWTIGGAQAVFEGMASGLRAQGFDVHIIELVAAPAERRFSALSTDPLLQTWDEARGIRGKWRIIRQLRALLNDKKIDVAIPALPSTNILTLLASLDRPIKVIVTEHTDPRTDDDIELVWRMLRTPAYLLRADALVGVSVGVTRHFDWLIGRTLQTIHNLLPAPPKTATGCTLSGDGGVRFGMVGRFLERKGFLDAIDAFALTHPEHHSARLDFYGEGPAKDIIRARIAHKGLGDRIAVHPPVRGEALDRAYSAMDCVLFPSYGEGLGNIIIEAMARHRPVIAYACDYGPGDLIRDKVSGWLIPVGDINGLSGQMKAIIDHPDCLAAVSQKAAADYAGNLHPAILIRQWSDLIARVAA